MKKKSNVVPTSIGGQAVIEGVMMRGPDQTAIAVRLPDGTIALDKKPLASVLKKYKILKLPIVRGVISFFSSMIVGVKALMYSAEFFDIEADQDQPPSKIDGLLEKIFGDKLKDAVIYFSVIIALIFGIGLVMLLPAALVKIIKNSIQSRVLASIVEGALRISIFLTYLLLVSRMKDIKRVFEYHGAEHKTIHCYEHKLPLTVENVQRFTRLHPRCGTSFLLIVMIISIIFFSFISWDSVWLMMLTRIALLPVVAGASYEIIKFAGRNSDNFFINILNKPGMWLQRLTTREPDGAQVEIAIEALKTVIPVNKDDDKW